MNEGRRRRRCGHRAGTLKAGSRLQVAHIGKVVMISQPVSIIFPLRRQRVAMSSQYAFSGNRLPRTSLVEQHNPCICHGSAPSRR